MTTVQKIIARNIRHFRLIKGITQAELAKALDISLSYIGYLERGEKTPSLDLLIRIADVLQVKPAHLLTEPDDLQNHELFNLLAFLSKSNRKTIRFIKETIIAYKKSLEPDPYC